MPNGTHSSGYRGLSSIARRDEDSPRHGRGRGLVPKPPAIQRRNSRSSTGPLDNVDRPWLPAIPPNELDYTLLRSGR